MPRKKKAEEKSLDELLNAVIAEALADEEEVKPEAEAPAPEPEIERIPVEEEPEEKQETEEEKMQNLSLGDLLDGIEEEALIDDRREALKEARPIWSVYTDGSYNKADGCYGYGVVIVEGGEVVQTLHGTGYPDPDENGWNINGEIAAAESAIRVAIENNCKEIIIFHDYEGVGKWADGEWNANKTYTQAYARFVADARRKLRISYVHVKGHSGNAYNEMADMEAKKGAGVA